MQACFSQNGYVILKILFPYRVFGDGLGKYVIMRVR